MGITLVTLGDCLLTGSTIHLSNHTSDLGSRTLSGGTPIGKLTSVVNCYRYPKFMAIDFTILAF